MFKLLIMKNLFLKLYTTIGLFLFTSILFAQPGSGSDGVPLEGNDTAATIDDYVLVLVMIGLIYFFIKIRANQKNKIQG